MQVLIAFGHAIPTCIYKPEVGDQVLAGLYLAKFSWGVGALGPPLSYLQPCIAIQLQ